MTHDQGWGPQGPDDGPHEAQAGGGQPAPGAAPYGQPPHQQWPYGQPPYGHAVPPYGWLPPRPPQPGVIPLGPPLGLGEILGGTFSTLSRAWKPLLGVGGALCGALVALIAVLAGTGYLTVKDTVDKLIDIDHYEPTGSETTGLVTAGSAALLVTLLAGLFVMGALYALAYVVLEPAAVGRPLGVREAWRRTRSRAWAMIGVSSLVGLIAMVPVAAAIASIVLVSVTVGKSSVGLAVLLGVLIGLAAAAYAVWVSVLLRLAPAVVVLEGASPVTALRRSAQLVRGAWWRTLGITLLTYLIVMTISQVAQLPMMLLPAITGAIVGGTQSLGLQIAAVVMLVLVLLVFMFITQVFTIAFMEIAGGLVYVDRRIRTEDLAPALLEAAGLAPAPVPAPAAAPAPQPPTDQPPRA
ncbi:hypothetical protein ACFQLX_00020 [Streptomyces polyrhachis]|uniref:DUF7847 domain-containing protein n=1 Tax=Streptomyces polyrhachis TaxID=1282885 RepID=A0ABW2G6Z6_9ACTN